MVQRQAQDKCAIVAKLDALERKMDRLLARLDALDLGRVWRGNSEATCECGGTLAVLTLISTWRLMAQRIA